MASVRGGNLVIQCPTGYGKAILCLIPAIAVGGITIYIVPTFALVDDLLDNSHKAGVMVYRKTGSSSHDEQALTSKALKTLQGGIVVVTPEMASSFRFPRML